MADGSSTGLFWPRPSLHVDGQERPVLAAALLGLTISESVCGLYRCEALFGNWNPAASADGFVYFDRRLLDFGKSFQVRFDDTTLFDGRIMALEGRFPQGSPPQIVVLADDRLQDLRMTRRTRSFAQMSDADVFRQISNRAAFSLRASGEYTELGGTHFRNALALRPALSYRFSSNAVTELAYAFTDSDYIAPTAAVFNRDGATHGLSVLHSFRLPGTGWGGALGASIGRNNTEGSDFQSDSVGVSATMRYTFANRIVAPIYRRSKHWQASSRSPSKTQPSSQRPRKPGWNWRPRPAV